MMSLTPIGNVYNAIDNASHQDFSQVVSTIVLSELLPESAVRELEGFSHVEIIYLFHRIGKHEVRFWYPHALPEHGLVADQIGIFAARYPLRPNRLGSCIARLEHIEGMKLTVVGLDALNGSPVLDIKPVTREMLPDRKSVMQPAWASQLGS